MPSEAIKTGAVEQVLALGEIATVMTRRVAIRPGAVKVAGV
jgi:chemotaxis response regulator CheB